jgi:hypothetical protein
MWFLFQRIIAILLSMTLFDAFQDVRSAWDVWITFRKMPPIAQIGSIAVALIVLFVIWETAFFLYRFTKPFFRRTLPHIFHSLNLWLKARRRSSTENEPAYLHSPDLHTDLAPFSGEPVEQTHPEEAQRGHASK